MAAGSGFTVIVAAAVHPVPALYVIMTVPGFTPVIIPLDEPIVATDILPLLHVPPGVASASDVVDPTHTPRAPVIGPAVVFTVTGAMALHPSGSV
jgi:hypothetical protein